jgi:hypothetical protein
MSGEHVIDFGSTQIREADDSRDKSVGFRRHDRLCLTDGPEGNWATGAIPEVAFDEHGRPHSMTAARIG